MLSIVVTLLWKPTHLQLIFIRQQWLRSAVIFDLHAFRACADQSQAPSVASSMACLNTDADKNVQTYKNFDIENMQPDQHVNGNSSTAAARKNGSNRRGCCSLPLLLSIAALIISLLALIFGIYGAVTARKLGRGPTDQGVYLTTNPQDAPSGYQAVNLFKVIKAGKQVDTCLPIICDSWAAMHVHMAAAAVLWAEQHDI